MGRKPDIVDPFGDWSGWEAREMDLIMQDKQCSVDGCTGAKLARGFCSKHYSRVMKYGSPFAGGTSPGEAQTYYREVVLAWDTDACLIWPYAKNKAGYGKLVVDGRLQHVHRLACIEVKGPPPTDRHEAAHLCGNGSSGCVNPHHVRWLTPSENQRERRVHGTDTAGERNATARLTKEQAALIKSLKGVMPTGVVAQEFGISKNHVRSIQSGWRWAGV